MKVSMHCQEGIGCRYMNITVKDHKMWNWFKNLGILPLRR